jgi:hypothetical protein
MLPYPQVTHVLGVEQVPDLFVVDFDVGHFDSVGQVWIGRRFGVDAVEELGRGEGDDAFICAV